MNQLNLFREIIVDNFAGGEEASTGIELATGLSVDIAINHDPAAIAMHEVNHPDTEHYCESVWDVDPKQAVRAFMKYQLENGEAVAESGLNEDDIEKFIWRRRRHAFPL